MKRLMQGIRTWSGCFDLMTDAVCIETDRRRESRELTENRTEGARSWSQQKINGAIAEIGEVALILAAVAVVFVPVVMLLWP